MNGYKTLIAACVAMVCATVALALKVIDGAAWSTVILTALGLWGGRELLTKAMNKGV